MSKNWPDRDFMRTLGVVLFAGFFIGIITLFLIQRGLKATSSNSFCAVCHVHPHAEVSWKKSTHFKNKAGMVVRCAECHLPPGGPEYLAEKARLGTRDGWSYLFKDKSKIDWEAKSSLEHARTYIYDSSCLRCHSDLYSLGLPPKGVKAHEYYVKEYPKVRCINCHLHVGHYSEKKTETADISGETIKIPSFPSYSGKFESYTDTIPGSDVTFNMVAVKGGEFTMGSPEKEARRDRDEGPQFKASLKNFWIGQAEITWREYDLFFSRTSTRGKTSEVPVADEVSLSKAPPKSGADTTAVVADGITGPTPPYGSPDQGWGKGMRPAITMTYYAAETYCKWLSKVTGHKYRLPTEAEWEYVCRAGTSTPYSFPGSAPDYTAKSLKNKIFGAKTDPISKFAWYSFNSGGKTSPVFYGEANPWGVYGMYGNVWEFCSDYYEADTYSKYSAGTAVSEPKGPSSGTEHVIRGGSYLSDPLELRAAARAATNNDRWMITDPQSPKSLWWYSDCKDVGFRIVRELE